MLPESERINEMKKSGLLRPLIALILFLTLIVITGCSQVREDPGDSFAPRPENAKSASYQIVRLCEGKHYGKWGKPFLLKLIENYRKLYETIKAESRGSTQKISKLKFFIYRTQCYSSVLNVSKRSFVQVG